MFKKYDTYAITGRFSVVPGGARAVYDAKTEMWELGGIYFSRYLGLDADGFYNPNPLLYPDFIAARGWIGSFQSCRRTTGIVHKLG